MPLRISFCSIILIKINLDAKAVVYSKKNTLKTFIKFRFQPINNSVYFMSMNTTQVTHGVPQLSTPCSTWDVSCKKICQVWMLTITFKP